MAWAMPQAMERLLATPTINARLPWRNPITSSLGFDAARGAAVGGATVLSPVKKSANSTENRPSRGQRRTPAYRPLHRECACISKQFRDSRCEGAGHAQRYRSGKNTRVGKSQWWMVALAALSLASCVSCPWNDPYPAAEVRCNVLFSAFTELPKHLDPARAD